MIQSAKQVNNILDKSQLEILAGYYHGDISINHADQYAERLKKLLN